MFSLFRSSDLSMTRAIPIAFLASAASVAVCIGVVAVANNKVEGLALMKLGGLSLMGIQAPFFLSGTSQYLFAHTGQRFHLAGPKIPAFSPEL